MTHNNFLKGLSIVPPADDDASLIQVTIFDSKVKEDYLNYMKEYLSKYPMESSNCDFETGQRTSGTIQEPCEFPLSLLGPCANPEKYLTDSNNACFYIKLNKVFFDNNIMSEIILDILILYFWIIDLWISSRC